MKLEEAKLNNRAEKTAICWKLAKTKPNSRAMQNKRTKPNKRAGILLNQAYAKPNTSAEQKGSRDAEESSPSQQRDAQWRAAPA